MAKPIDGEVANDGDKPCREAGGVSAFCEVAAKATEILCSQGLAHLREHVHDLVVLRCVVPDRREDEAAIALDEEIPGAVEILRLELGDPIAHASTPPRVLGYTEVV